MNRQQKIVIADRLDRYLGYTPEQSLAIIQQLCYALDIEDGADAIITTESKLEDRMDIIHELAAHDAERTGYMQAIEDVRRNELICNDSTVNIELSKLQANYLDEY